MCVGKVVEEDGEDQQGVHTLDEGVLGMTPPTLRKRDIEVQRRLGMMQRSQSWFVHS